MEQSNQTKHNSHQGRGSKPAPPVIPKSMSENVEHETAAPSAPAHSDSGSADMSLETVLTQVMSPENKQVVDDVMFHVGDYLATGKKYIDAKPAEAVGLAASFGLAAWALLCTEPGRQLFNKGVAVIGPEVSKWISANVPKAN